MFYEIKDGERDEPILQSFDPIEYQFLYLDNFDFFSEKENKIVENINKGDFNNEFKKKDNSDKNKYLEENTGFTSKILSSKIIKENQNNLNQIKIRDNFSENSIDDKIISTKNKIQININDIQKQKPKKEKKLLGRKSKNSDESGAHNKFSDDNLSRRCKHIILDYLFIFINYFIKNIYNLPKENKIQLLKINQRQVLNTKVDYNLNFLNKTLKDIFSDNLSTKYRKYSPQHNKTLIEQLLNEKEETKKNIFEKLFSLTFFDCLKYFRGEINIDILDGMVRLDKACEKFKNEKDYEDYIPTFRNFILNFETIIQNKKVRDRKK